MIAARPETIFRYFTDPGRFARWMGQGSVLDPRPGGRLRVGCPTGQVAGRRDGRRRLYRARREHLGPLADVLEGLWRDRLEDLKTLAEAEERAGSA